MSRTRTATSSPSWRCSKSMLRLTLPLIFVVALAAHCFAAPPAPRPYSGCGVLELKGGAGSLALYREPGVQRIKETTPALLPRLSGDDKEPLLAAGARRGGWIRLSMDDAGREGWLEERRGWQYSSWREFLPGRTVRVLPGLRKGWYALRSMPGEAGSEIGAVSRDRSVRVLEVATDWARLEAPAGWFRWRDGDGRLTVSLQAAP